MTRRSLDASYFGVRSIVGRCRGALVERPGRPTPFQGKKLCPLSAPAIYGKPGEEIHVGGILLGPHADGGEGDFKVSPYLPKNADPRIVVVDMLEHEEQKELVANKDGIIENNGKLWATAFALEGILGISKKTVASRVKDVESIIGKTVNCRTRTFYSIEGMRVRCEDLLRELPSLDAEGFVTIDDEVWGTSYAIAKQCGISNTRVHERIHQCRTIEVRDRGRRVGRAISLKDFLVAAGDLAKADLLKAEADGFITIDGVSYAPLGVLAETFDVRTPTIIERLTPQIRKCRAKDRRGRAADFYAKEDVQVALQDLLAISYKLNTDGFVELDGAYWWPIPVLAKKFGISINSMRVRTEGLPKRQALNAKDHVVSIVAESAAHQACASFLDELPSTDSSGFIEIGGVRWALATAIAKKLGCRARQVIIRARCNACRTTRARDSERRVHQFLSVEDFIKSSPDLLKGREQLLIEA